MQPRTVEVEAPSRLHFGMFAFGGAAARQFGGVGAMIARPRLRLRCETAGRFEAAGHAAERVAEFASLLVASRLIERLPACRMTIDDAPTAHVGLGSGTQLGMAVAAALMAWNGAQASAARLAAAVGRGRRSAVGVHGFERGGFIVECGKRSDDEISPLVARCELCHDWRIVLARPACEIGMSGDAERRAFQRMPPVPTERTAELCRIALLGLLPAVADSDFDGFAAALGDFGRLSGRSFATEQCGTFATPRTARLVEAFERAGARGVGQTSWGPTVYALARDDDDAAQLVERLRRVADDELEALVTPFDNRGATIRVSDGST